MALGPLMLRDNGGRDGSNGYAIRGPTDHLNLNSGSKIHYEGDP